MPASDERTSMWAAIWRELARLKRENLRYFALGSILSLAISLACVYWTNPSLITNLSVSIINAVANAPSSIVSVLHIGAVPHALEGVLRNHVSTALFAVCIGSAGIVFLAIFRRRWKRKMGGGATEPVKATQPVKNPEEPSRINQPPTQSTAQPIAHASWGRLHFYGVDPRPDPSTGKRLRRGIYASDRVHTLIVGRTGYGKTRLLLSMIKQHIDNDEGFMVIDTHRDLAPLVLSHIPPEKAHKVIYINPMTAFDKRRVVQINFLEYKDPGDRDIIARLFMDSLEKIYERWWGPRLDMILLNALYLLMEREGATLPQLYNVLTDEVYREQLLRTCRDERVRSFWEQQYKKMPSDASMAVLTKIYKIVQERVIIPMFEAERSSVDLRQAMDSGAFIVVDLPEGSMTTDLANFIGSLILARLYLAGMSREDLPESQRKPFYVYVDEAYRFTTKSIADILQSLRKYKVFMTLASQFLEQYIPSVQRALPECCDTVICFTVGENTARMLEHLYPKEFGFQALMNLPQRHFFISTTFAGSREYAILQTMDIGMGPHNVESIVEKSLLIHGREVDPDKLYGKIHRSAKEELCRWPVTPAEWQVLLALRRNGNSISEEALFSDRKVRERLSEAQIAQAIKNLMVETINRKQWIEARTVRKRMYKEYFYEYGRKEVKAEERDERIFTLLMVDAELSRLLTPNFRGQRAGDLTHMQMTMNVLRTIIWANGWIARVDTGEEVGEEMPDILVSPTKDAEWGDEAMRGRINPNEWDYDRTFAVEVETQPEKHWDRVLANIERNAKMKLPTAIAVPSDEEAAYVRRRLADAGLHVVENILRFGPNQLGVSVFTVPTVRVEAPGEGREAGGEQRPHLQIQPTGKLALFLREMMRAGFRYEKADGKLILKKKVGDGREIEVDAGPYDQRIDLIVKILELHEKKVEFSARLINGTPYIYANIGSGVEIAPYDEVTESVMSDLAVEVRGLSEVQAALAGQTAPMGEHAAQPMGIERTPEPIGEPLGEPTEGGGLRPPEIEEETLVDEGVVAVEEGGEARVEEPAEKEAATLKERLESLLKEGFKLTLEARRQVKYVYAYKRAGGRRMREYVGSLDEIKTLLEELRDRYGEVAHFLNRLDGLNQQLKSEAGNSE